MLETQPPDHKNAGEHHHVDAASPRDISIDSRHSGRASSSDDEDTTDEDDADWLPMRSPNIVRTDGIGMVAWKRDYLILVGGTSDETRQCTNSVEMYQFQRQHPPCDNDDDDDHDPRLRSSCWKPLPKLNIARRHCACCIVQDRYLYVLGGNSNANGSFVDLASVERLDLEQPVAFELVDDLPIPIRNATAFVWEDQIYLVGGYSSRLENTSSGSPTSKCTRRKNGSQGNTNHKQGEKNAGGYLATLLRYHANAEAMVVTHIPAGSRRLPALFVLPQQRRLVIVGGYHPDLGWTTDGWILNLDDWSWSSRTTTDADDAGGGGGSSATPASPTVVPNLPMTHGDAIFAYWTIGNQCHLISHRTYLMWEYGTNKWQHEPADHVCGTRGLAMPNTIVAYDAKQWWYLDRPTSLGNLSIESIQRQITACQAVLEQATTAGYWELPLLDQAATAATRLPILEQLYEMLETIEQLERRKHCLVEQFADLQQNRKFQECRSLAWSIRDIENALEIAYDGLWNHTELVDVANGADPQQRQQHHLPRMKSSVRLGGQLKRLSSISGHRRRQSPGHQAYIQQQQHGSSLTGDNHHIVGGSGESKITINTPTRRKSSLLLRGLLSKRNIKELVLCSDPSKTGGVY